MQMSDNPNDSRTYYLDDEDYDNKFSLVITNPQRGKTYICIKGILNDSHNLIHIVTTMNTLSASNQFSSRIEETIGSNKIIAFNSKPDSFGKWYHAKKCDEIIKLIKKYPMIKVIICCAHSKKIKDSLPELIGLIEDSKTINRKIKFHIDEAHCYIPPNREQITEFIRNDIVESIVGYTATPYKIWINEMKKTDQLFYKIYIRDIEAEYGIMHSDYYYSIKMCNVNIYQDVID
jgi:hypothetical protein